jgi:hypothetical protein
LAGYPGRRKGPDHRGLATNRRNRMTTKIITVPVISKAQIIALAVGDV